MFALVISLFFGLAAAMAVTVIHSSLIRGFYAARTILGELALREEPAAIIPAVQRSPVKPSWPRLAAA